MLTGEPVSIQIDGDHVEITFRVPLDEFSDQVKDLPSLREAQRRAKAEKRRAAKQAEQEKKVWRKRSIAKAKDIKARFEFLRQSGYSERDAVGTIAKEEASTLGGIRSWLSLYRSFVSQGDIESDNQLRQARAFALWKQGKANTIIAQKLGVSTRTIQRMIAEARRSTTGAYSLPAKLPEISND